MFWRAHMAPACAKSERAYAIILNDCNTFRSVPRLCGIHITGARGSPKPHYMHSFLSSSLALLVSMPSASHNWFEITSGGHVRGISNSRSLRAVGAVTHNASSRMPTRPASPVSTQSTINPSSIIIISFGRPSHRNSSFVHT